MSRDVTPTFDKHGQAALFEVESEPAAPEAPTPTTKRARRAKREEVPTRVEPLATSATSADSPEPDARALLAEMLPRWALERAQHELARATKPDPEQTGDPIPG